MFKIIEIENEHRPIITEISLVRVDEEHLLRYIAQAYDTEVLADKLAFTVHDEYITITVNIPYTLAGYTSYTNAAYVVKKEDWLGKKLEA